MKLMPGLNHHEQLSCLVVVEEYTGAVENGFMERPTLKINAQRSGSHLTRINFELWSVSGHRCCWQGQ